MLLLLCTLYCTIVEITESHFTVTYGHQSRKHTLEFMEGIVMISRNIDTPIIFVPCYSIKTVPTGYKMVVVTEPEPYMAGIF